MSEASYPLPMIPGYGDLAVTATPDPDRDQALTGGKAAILLSGPGPANRSSARFRSL